MNKPFIQSGVCASGQNCATCRDKEGGRDNRKSWRSMGYLMPGDGDDWECPSERGARPWGFTALTVTASPVKSRGFGDTIAKITSAVGIRPCGRCKKTQAALNKLLPYKQSDPATPPLPKSPA